MTALTTLYALYALSALYALYALTLLLPLVLSVFSRRTIVADIRRSIAHPARLAYFQMTPSRRPTLARKFSQLRESGVVLLIGTDAGIPTKFHSMATGNELDAWVRRHHRGERRRTEIYQSAAEVDVVIKKGARYT